MSEFSPDVKHKLERASRVFLAAVCGYAFASFITFWIERKLPYDALASQRAAGMMFFLFYACAVIWVFSNAKTRTVWAVMILLIVVSGLIAFSGGTQ